MSINNTEISGTSKTTKLPTSKSVNSKIQDFNMHTELANQPLYSQTNVVKDDLNTNMKLTTTVIESPRLVVLNKITDAQNEKIRRLDNKKT